MGKFKEDAKLKNETIQFQGAEVKMTYGLLNTLCRVVGEVDAAMFMSIDNDIRERVLVELLSSRDAKGKITDEISIFDITANPDDVAALLDWAQELVIDFFVQRTEKMTSLVLPLTKKVAALKASLSGGAP